MRFLFPLTFAVALAAAVALPAGTAKAASGPPATSFSLDNGMQVVVIEDHRAPVVTHMVWYKVGAADEVPGKSGIAHFLEHLLFKGTETVASGEFSKMVAINGGNDNAFTASDYTAYHQRIARDRLDMLMRYEADRMTGLKITDEEVETERQVVLEERASRTDSNPRSLLNEQMSATLYRNHPYGRPIIGWEHEIQGLTRSDIVDFYRRHYRPSNAVLVVAGDVTPEEVRTLAEQTYGRIENPPYVAGVEPERNRPKEPPSLAPRRIEMTDARAGTTSVTRMYLTPSYSTAGAGRGEGLELLAEIVGGGSTGRLYRELVVRRGIAVDAGAWYHGGQLDYGEFGVYAMPAEGVEPAQVEAAIQDVFDDLADNGVTDAELARAKTQVVASAVYALDSQTRLARNFGSSLTTGGTVADVLEWPDRVAAAEGADVVAALRSYLRPERSVTGILAPATRQEGGRT